MEFQDKLKELRNQKGVSQYKLAEDLSVSRSVVAKWETGLVAPSEELLQVLCAYFSVSKEELLGSSQTSASISPSVKYGKLRRKANVFFCIALLLVSILCIVLATVCINKNYAKKHRLPTDASEMIALLGIPCFIGLIACVIAIYVARRRIRKYKKDIPNIKNASPYTSALVKRTQKVSLITCAVLLVSLFLPFFADVGQDMHNYLCIVNLKTFSAFGFLFVFTPVTYVFDYEEYVPYEVPYEIIRILLWILSIAVFLATVYFIISVFLPKYKDEKYAKIHLWIAKIASLVFAVLFLLIHIATWVFRGYYQYTWGGEGLFFYVAPSIGMYIGLIVSVIGFMYCWFVKKKG